MSIRRIKVNGRKVWQARVAYRGLRTSALRDSQQAARAKEGGEEYIQWKPLPSQFPRDN